MTGDATFDGVENVESMKWNHRLWFQFYRAVGIVLNMVEEDLVVRVHMQSDIWSPTIEQAKRYARIVETKI